ncbi:hypothetical protein B0H14DRAFT_3866036 [Mycena olivaceomarginata]|nr:hypothetical protein B0H14DRAFT_3866036 [Mycena olivaceomarginata]
MVGDDGYILGAHLLLHAQWALYDLLSVVAHVQRVHEPRTEPPTIASAGVFDWCHWCGLATISSLNHLALSPSIATEILASVVTDRARLALVVLANGTHQTDWMLGAWGSDDFWVRAMASVNLKRAGGIDGACYVLEETLTMPPP